MYSLQNTSSFSHKAQTFLEPELRDIHFIWLAGYEKPDFITINRFRNRIKAELNNVFTQDVHFDTSSHVQLFCQQVNTVFLYHDKSAFVQIADSFLIYFLAHLKPAFDVFGIAFIA